MEWFVLKNGDVLGPFEAQNVVQMFGTQPGDILVWGVPHHEWMAFHDWAQKVNVGGVGSANVAPIVQPHTDTNSAAPMPSSPIVEEAAKPVAEPGLDVQAAAEPVTEHPQAQSPLQVDEVDHSDPADQIAETQEQKPDPQPLAESDFSMDNFESSVSAESSEESAATNLDYKELDEDGPTQISSELPLSLADESELEKDLPDFSTESSVPDSTGEFVMENQPHEKTDEVEAVSPPSYAFKENPEPSAEIEIEEEEEQEPQEQDELEAEADEASNMMIITDDEAAKGIEAQEDIAEIEPSSSVSSSNDDSLKDLLGDALSFSDSESEDDEDEDAEEPTRVSAASEPDMGEWQNESSHKDEESLDLNFENLDNAAPSDSDLDLNFSGSVEENEEATRVESFFNDETEDKATAEDAENNSLVWSGESANDEEATMVQVAQELQSENADLDLTEEDDEEEATRVSLSSDEDSFDIEEEATRVSASGEAETQEYDSFDIEEEATRVSASTVDKENEAEELDDALRLIEELNAADEDDQNDHDEYEALAIDADEDVEVTQDTDLQALEDQLEEVSASSEEDQQTEVDAGSVLEPSAQQFDETAEEGEPAKDYDIAGATEVAQLKDIARKIKEDKEQCEEPVWYVAYEGETEGPMTASEVFKHLDDYEVKDFIYLWREGFLDWKNLFDVSELSSNLGIGFRRHSRVHASGTVSIEFAGGTQIGQLDNLSESGLGVTGIDGMHLGDIVRVKVEADEMSDVVVVVGKVRFVSESGLIGLSYEKKKHTDSIEKIIDFVKSKSSQAAA